jgi:hypothetical protein
LYHEERILQDFLLRVASVIRVGIGSGGIDADGSTFL